MRTLLLLMLVPLCLSGCASLAHVPTDAASASTSRATSDLAATDAAAPAVMGMPAGAAAAPTVLFRNGTVVAGINAPPASVTPTMYGLGFQVTNATLVYIELAWDSPLDLDLCVSRPSTAPFGPFTGCDDPAFNIVGSDSPLHVSYPTPEPGKWGVHPTSGTVAANVPYRMAVTLFFGPTEVPAGYSAFR